MDMKFIIRVFDDGDQPYDGYYRSLPAALRALDILADRRMRLVQVLFQSRRGVYREVERREYL